MKETNTVISSNDLKAILNTLLNRATLDYDGCVDVVKKALREADTEDELSDELLDNMAKRVTSDLIVIEKTNSPVVINVTTSSDNNDDTNNSGSYGITTVDDSEEISPSTSPANESTWARRLHVQPQRLKRREKFKPAGRN